VEARLADETVLRQKVEYVTSYTPSLLNSMPRASQRRSLGITDELPFRGVDIWNGYEFSWLNNRGKPEVALAQFMVPCASDNMPESKSLKHYLGSFSQTQFANRSEVMSTLESDLHIAARTPVICNLMQPDQVLRAGMTTMPGHSLDLLDVDVDDYYWNPDFLEVESDTIIRESLFTNLFKSLCPLTGQPDFATIMVLYNGRGISHEGLLRYLVSYREHAEFAEQVVERIFVDIINRCMPDRLTIQARFARRGGIDINPFRSHDDGLPQDMRVWRQ